MLTKAHGIYFLSLLFLFTCNHDAELSVCFTGDIMLDREIEEAVSRKGASDLVNSIEPLLKQYHYRFANLECPLTTIDNKIGKQFSFRADPKMVAVLRELGITHASMANNHSNDQKSEGAKETFQTLQNENISILGYGLNEKEACNPVELEDGSAKLAVFGAVDLALTDEELKSLCSCGEYLFTKIKDYKSKNPNTLIVCYNHWGFEYQAYPSPSQRENARKLIDAGADAIIGHHAHVIQQIDYYKGKPIFYGLGNFIFDQENPQTRFGLIAGFKVESNRLIPTISPLKIVHGKPTMISSEEKTQLQKELMETSPRITLGTVKDGWLVTQNDLVSTQNLVPEDFPSFDSLQIADKYFTGTVSLKRLSHRPGYRLSATSDKGKEHDVYLPYPVYRFETSDINRDGRTDVLIGVRKTTHFEPQIAKRLFAIRIDAGRLRPLWLGSKVCQDLVDFRPITKNHKTLIITLEKDAKEKYYIGYYDWRDFGLELIEYRNSTLDYSVAKTIFQNETSD